MANFFLINSGSQDGTSQVLARVKENIKPVEGLVIGSVRSGGTHLVWAINPEAPIQVHERENGFAVLFGHAYNDDTGTPISADDLLPLQNTSGKRPSTQTALHNGYHLSVAYSLQNGLSVTTDPLGLFPVYYSDVGGDYLVSSTPELFRIHPKFEPEINPVALAGMCLLGYASGGEPLLSGVTRLSPGHVLELSTSPPFGFHERRVFALESTDAHYHIPFSDQADLLQEAFIRAVGSTCQESSNVGVLLSGGLDSRCLAGASEHLGLKPHALTWGRRDDGDLECAALVCRELGYRHTFLDQSFLDETDVGSRQAKHRVKWEHLENGLNNLPIWETTQQLRPYCSEILTGYCMDGIISGSYINKAYDPETQSYGFDRFLENLNAYGIPLERLRRTANPDFQAACDAAKEKIRDRYEQGSEFPFAKPWFFHISHRQRFHIGGMLWALSFSSWPLLTMADGKLLKAVTGMPGSSILNRRLQEAMLLRHSPSLASLPLDNNSGSLRTLKPRLRDSIKSAIQDRLTAFMPSRTPAVGSFYRRVYDFNGNSWRSVRELAHPNHSLLGAYFACDSLLEMLPSPEQTVGSTGASFFQDVAGYKLLNGLVLYLQDLR